MKKTTVRRTAALTAAATVAGLAAAGIASGEGLGWPWPSGGGGHEPRPLVSLAASPDRVEIVPLPCFSGRVQLQMTNPGAEPVYADATVQAQAPLEADRGAFSSWLPAGFTARAPVVLRAPRTAPAGDYELRVASARTRLVVPVTVAPVPPKGPGDNLAYGEQATASSTHGNFDVCGAVDGNANPEEWDTLTGWNDATRAVFPDTYGVALAAAAAVDRVTLHTLDSARYPAARNGLRDYDVRLRVDGAWTTVAQVRGNVAGVVESRFDPVVADAVEIVGLAANDGAYSRIVELEVWGAAAD